ncbi:hypothetical protein BG011_007115 [Mortierella polycephala]|uniref:SMAD/FHA domain-containing protein n=1 Tax=Mortierella polycephala TaxID=41804 RepID=A0A9P6PT11_9FUNG|nr:hypothetical protein BG011_007115 [Mortierella polycephala]
MSAPSASNGGAHANHATGASSSTSTSSPTSASAPATPATATVPHIRIVPHLDAPRSLHFDVVDKDIPDGFVLKIGRFTDKQALPNRVTFKSKVVSRGHAEIYTEQGKFYIRDTKSSSGTFLNHVRLSPPGTPSVPTLLKDGDVIQLGVDYQGGTQEIYRCVKMRLELNRSWQQRANTFRKNTLKTIRSLTTADASSCTDCCICLFRIASFQSLFVAPCSHVYHYKCIRPMLVSNHPGFLCPLCRTFADLEDPVEIDDPIEEEGAVESNTAAAEGGTDGHDSVEHLGEPEAAAIPQIENIASPVQETMSSPPSPSPSHLESSGSAQEHVSPQLNIDLDPATEQYSTGTALPMSSSPPSSAAAAQQQTETTASSTRRPMDISTESSSSAVNSMDQQSPSSAFFLAPSPPMFLSSVGVTPIPFTTAVTNLPSTSRHSSASTSPPLHQSQHTPSSPPTSHNVGQIFQNFVRNITIPHRNRSRTNSNSATSPTTPLATSHNGGSLGHLQGPSNASDMFGKTLAMSPPSMNPAHHRTGNHSAGFSELGAVSEVEAESRLMHNNGHEVGSSSSSSSSHSDVGSSSSRSSSQNRGARQGVPLHPPQPVPAEALT